ncbi:response regulator transcription factor [Azoarcus olearius]|uniref:Two-component response regulator n=1 Tax=Azoarcus sp. (strain BH72) TaxID=418699 RepID=A1K2L9_AZOSB|nr:response regulator transcription factor [Azoarcus olearius]ANQ83544.1 two-component response regulator [Azoarcus olearius]CAL93074.1 two-component response regulator [Azoarcus olearius]
MKILLVEDDAQQAGYIRKGLQEAGHTVDVAADGRDGLFLATTASFDAIVLDRMLPRVDGLTVLRTLRASRIATPVVVLSALGEVDDRVAGLRAGSDDYLVKPFALSELLARLDALQRRGNGRAEAEQTRLQTADLEMDLLRRSVSRGATRIELKPKEFRLLEFLLRHSGQVVTRSMLLEAVWDYHFDPQTNVIDVHISNLRAKIDLPGLPPLIHTVRGAGYRLGGDAA